ncbi:hypothetical protein TPHA_0F02810 [Tetrapisispora phaffii CBS 4417]|uniref:ER-derived vesicles protein ERV14 n=1 Tax=Tetrapisispora phaffii (strain ATCC 24235 / CBS 4417 / NBRC 1672 / NRRL Y-8282 / UCD 70-5) TaxID=1071381 RepID=G8BUH6_TETPH|nr:hypothetical protein TPHA_0F02810 [Tetrapisispora phaffii CBS 4417]CCE63762.1 hypothetical protein TPHA_0F02810 [Tetrapisispora phaffii CBS 4417]
MHNLYVYIAATIINCLNILGQIHFTVLYGDLEADYLNPIDLCSRINKLVLPEALVQCFGTFLYLITGNFITFLINLPLSVFNIRKIMNKTNKLDATEIFRTLKKNKTETTLKLTFYVFLFFYYVFFLIKNIIDYAST